MAGLEKQPICDLEVTQDAPQIEKQSIKPQEPPYSVFPKWKKVTLVYIASVAAFASPVSSSIYFPAMTYLANDLHTSLTNISLTITTYMVSYDFHFWLSYIRISL